MPRARATMSGRVTVPSSRSVPRCLPVRSAGPGRRRGRRRAAGRRGRCGGRTRRAPPRVAAALERAELAGGLEQARGLEVAALQVALAGDARRPTRPRAGAARRGASAGRRVGQDADLVGAAVAGQLGERLGEEQVAGRGRHLPARPRRRRSAGRGAATRRRARRRGRASRSARARPRRRRAAGAPRRLPVRRARRRGRRAAAAAACRRRRSSRPACSPSTSPCSRGQRAAAASSSRSISARDVGAGGLDDGEDGLGARPRQAAPGRGACAMMPPRGQHPADVGQAGARRARRRAPPGPGKRFTELGRYV